MHVRVCVCMPQTASAQSQESPRPVREPILTASEKLQVRLFGKHSTVKHREPREGRPVTPVNIHKRLLVPLVSLSRREHSAIVIY